MKVPVVVLEALRFIKFIVKPSYGRFPAPKPVIYNWMVHEQYRHFTHDYLLRFIEGKTGNVVEDTIVMLRSCSGELYYYADQLYDGWRRVDKPANGRYEVVVGETVIGYVNKISGINKLEWSVK